MPQKILGILDEAGADSSNHPSSGQVEHHDEQRAGIIEEEKIEML